MRIDGNNPIDKKELYNKVQETTDSKEADKKKNVGKPESEGDKISVSGTAKEISELKAAIDQLPDIRTDKVDALKKAIDTGNYNIDPRKIAEKILEEI
ncbi:MAG: flagellar biosynthesis anti-sigma factor FlgM [Nitrospiraceae bacterium]|nr:MAG: flagellar biosynthesis anti-sigma factor FlgM [Nitrospiraceae bacterium]